LGEVIALFTQQMEDDTGHAAGDDGDGGVGRFATVPMAAVEDGEVSRATDVNRGQATFLDKRSDFEQKRSFHLTFPYSWAIGLERSSSIMSRPPPEPVQCQSILRRS